MPFHRNCIPRTARLSVEQSARLRYAARGLAGETTAFMTDRAVIRPGGSAVLFDAGGCGFLQVLRLTVPVGADACRVRIHTREGAKADADQTVRDLFLSGEQGRTVLSDYSGKILSRDASAATFYRRLFCPFSSGCRIELVNTGGEPVDAELSVQYARRRTAARYGRFSRLAGVESRGRAREAGQEVVLLDLCGRGALHSIQLSLSNRLKPCYMEGNMEIYIDGNDFPEYQSTGTEEFFMGGIYFTNLHNSAYSGCTRTFNDGAGNPDNAVSAHRIFDEDAITFDSRLRIVWHNGQARQGPVPGSTAYDFAAVCYLDDGDGGPAPAADALEAQELLDALDGDRLRRALLSVHGSSCTDGPGSVLFTLSGAGSLETLHLSLRDTAAADETRIRFEIDGRRTDAVPLPLFFRCPRGLETGEICGDAGKTGAATFYRHLDIPYRESLAVLLEGGGHPLARYHAEYREGTAAAFYRTEIRLLAGTDEYPEPLASGGGFVEEAAFAGAALDRALLEWTAADGAPIAAQRLSDLLLADSDCSALGTSESMGLLRSAAETVGYRSFSRDRFAFEDGLCLRIAPAEPGDLAAMLILRVREDRPQRPPLSTGELGERLNRADLACGAYEMRCYNPIEGPDGKIAPGETRILFEDFGAGALRCLRLGTPPFGPALHEARLRLTLNGESVPAIDTTCARFFSADYDDPIFWSHTRRLSRLSKRGAENPKSGCQHSGFFRYITIPYQNGAVLTLTAPADSMIDGFDNVYYASERSGVQPFGAFDHTRCLSVETAIPAGGEVSLGTWEGEGAISGIQLRTIGGADASAVVLKIESDGRRRIEAPLWCYFLGAPPEETPDVIGEYDSDWREVIGREEGYYSAPDNGWIRRGTARNVFYRLLDERPIPLCGKSAIRLFNPTTAEVTVQSDITVRY